MILHQQHIRCPREIRARRDSEALRQDADVYIMDVLNRLEEDLTRTLTVVQNGMQKVEADQQAMAEAAASEQMAH